MWVQTGPARRDAMPARVRSELRAVRREQLASSASLTNVWAAGGGNSMCGQRVCVRSIELMAQYRALVSVPITAGNDRHAEKIAVAYAHSLTQSSRRRKGRSWSS